MICIHPKCQRDDLPAAAAMPRDARIPCSHARPDGEPCSEVANMYDEEVHELIATEPVLWDDEVRPLETWFDKSIVTLEVTDPEQIALLQKGKEPISVGYQVARHEIATAREVRKPDRRGPKRRQDDKTKTRIAEARPVQDAIAARLLELRVVQEETPPAKQVAKATKKADVQIDQTGDVDDWEP